jgi:thiol-disulfide isomerase/thioredoxin
MPRSTIEDMHRIASERGGKCLSEEYVNSNTKLTWQCAEGHVWEAVPKHVLHSGSWCRKCSTKIRVEREKFSIEMMRKIASERGGKCLSTEYVNNNTKLKWKCSEGHVWSAVYGSIQQGTWCPDCAGKRPQTLEDAKRVAVERNGKCLSKEMKDSNARLKWMCEHGHTWSTSFNKIKNQGSWCPTCAGKSKYTIEVMDKWARENNGKCLSRNYVNVDTQLEWMCSEGHVWKATPNTIQQGHWCLKCSGRERLTIEEMRQIASERGGKCLSTEYVNNNTKLKWQCAEGHVWEAVPGAIKSGQWCSNCNFYLSEQICRTTFEQLFKSKFPKNKPSWLINSRGNRMELDGYSADLKIAFEYNGVQHYEINYYTDTEEKLRRRIEDDTTKFELCKKMGVSLFVFDFNDDLSELPNLIKLKSRELGLNLRGIDFDTPIDLSDVYHGKVYIKYFKELAKSRNGVCLSNSYSGAGKKLKWKCSEGHIWEATANSVNRGSWCLKCSGNERLTIEEMRQIASERGGKCLSTEYVNSSTKLKWQCAEGHVWEAMPSTIKNRNSWCKICSDRQSALRRRTISIDYLHRIASERGGKCLSEEYVNSNTKLTWQCAEGHVWEAVPKHVLYSGSWCRKCSSRRAAAKRRQGTSQVVQDG